MTPCSICTGPYHEATGHHISATQRWCGPCTRDFVDWLWRNQRRRWGKMRFYDFAMTPEEAVRRREALPGSPAGSPVRLPPR